jgi:hypothetical protein
MAKRIYAVNDGSKVRLIEAVSKVHAISHVVQSSLSAAVPSQQELIALIKQGVAIEDAGDSKRGRRSAAVAAPTAE